MNIRQVREERDKLAMKSENIVEVALARPEGKRGLTEEESAEHERIHIQVDEYDTLIKVMEANEARSEPPPVRTEDIPIQAGELHDSKDPEAQRLNFISWLIGNQSRGSYILGDAFMTQRKREQMEHPKLAGLRWEQLERKQRDFMSRVGVDTAELKALGVDIRALGVNVGETGGYLVDSMMSMSIDKAMLDNGRILNTGIKKISTATGGPYPMPLNDDTGNRSRIVGEGKGTARTDLKYGNVTLGAYRYSTGVILISLEALQDSAFDLESEVFSSFGIRHGRGIGADLVTGSNGGELEGIVNASVRGLQLGAAVTTITYDNLVDLEESLDEAYHGMAEYAFNQNTRGLLRKIKDMEGIPLLRFMDTPDGPVSIFSNKKYTIVNEMPNLASGNRFMLWGDFSKYCYRTVMGFQIFRQMEQYIEDGQIGLIGHARADGKLVDASKGEEESDDTTGAIRHMSVA